MKRRILLILLLINLILILFFFIKNIIPKEFDNSIVRIKNFERNNSTWIVKTKGEDVNQFAYIIDSDIFHEKQSGGYGLLDYNQDEQKCDIGVIINNQEKWSGEMGCFYKEKEMDVVFDEKERWAIFYKNFFKNQYELVVDGKQVYTYKSKLDSKTTLPGYEKGKLFFYSFDNEKFAFYSLNDLVVNGDIKHEVEESCEISEVEFSENLDNYILVEKCKDHKKVFYNNKLIRSCKGNNPTFIKHGIEISPNGKYYLVYVEDKIYSLSKSITPAKNGKVSLLNIRDDGSFFYTITDSETNAVSLYDRKGLVNSFVKFDHNSLSTYILRNIFKLRTGKTYYSRNNGKIIVNDNKYSPTKDDSVKDVFLVFSEGVYRSLDNISKSEGIDLLYGDIGLSDENNTVDLKMKSINVSSLNNLFGKDIDNIWVNERGNIFAYSIVDWEDIETHVFVSDKLVSIKKGNILMADFVADKRFEIIWNVNGEMVKEFIDI